MKWGAFYRQNKNLIYMHNRRETTGEHSKEDWEKLCSFFDGICPRCGRKTDKFTKDHIIPLSRGGTNSLDNLQPLCQRCNVQKSNLYEVDYRTEEARKWVETC